MNIKNNQRARMTKNSIRRVFILLLKEKDLTDITINEICRAAEINRTTFYAHYKDIFDLMETLWKDMATQVQAIFYDEHNASGWGLPNHCFESLFDFILKNIDFYKACIRNGRGDTILDFPMFGCSESQIKPLASRAGIRSEREGKYRLSFFQGGLTAIIRHWINQGCVEKPEELALFLYNEYQRVDQ